MAYNNSQLFIKAAILLLLVSLASAYFGTGPYEIENLHLNPCDDQGTNELNLTFQMYRTQDRTKRVLAHRGGFNVPNERILSVSMNVYKKGTDWILFTDYEEEYCKAIGRSPRLWNDMWEASGYKNMSCPAIPGRYTFEEFIVQADPVTPVLPYGEYKAIFNVRNGKKEVIGCLCVLADIVQKFL